MGRACRGKAGERSKEEAHDYRIFRSLTAAFDVSIVCRRVRSERTECRNRAGEAAWTSRDFSIATPRNDL